MTAVGDEAQPRIDKLRADISSLQGIEGGEVLLSAKKSALEELLAKRRAEKPLGDQLKQQTGAADQANPVMVNKS